MKLRNVRLFHITNMKIITAFFFVATLASAALVQTPEVLHDFSGGANPLAPLVQGPDGNFYGTTQVGGASGGGMIFKMTPAGTVTTLVDFAGPEGFSSWLVGLIADRDGNLYGTTEHGGSGLRGTVFKVTLDGHLMALVHFDGTNGAVA